eukprot:scaffold189117_cov26-Tisochrysis_lutea.AAC.1
MEDWGEGRRRGDGVRPGGREIGIQGEEGGEREKKKRGESGGGGDSVPPRVEASPGAGVLFRSTVEEVGEVELLPDSGRRRFTAQSGGLLGGVGGT